MRCCNCLAVMQEKKSNMGQNIYYCPSCHLRMVDLNALEIHHNHYEILLHSVEYVREINYKKIIKCIKKIFGEKSIVGLEVGCAEGKFIEEARLADIHVVGIEPMRSSFEIARGKGLDVYCGLFPDDFENFNSSYDFVVFNDVFEHIPDSKKVLERCKELLTDDGVIIINLPLSTGITYKCAEALDLFGKGFLMRRLYQLDTDSPHVLYYNNYSINRVLFDCGFAPIFNSKRMKSYSFKNIDERINAVPMTTGKKGRLFMKAGAYIVYPFIGFLPADTRAFFYKNK